MMYQMAATALLIVDMVKGFFGADPLPGDVPGAEGIVQRQRDLIAEARRRGISVVYICDRYSEGERPHDREFQEFGVHCVEGTPGAEILDELEVEDSDLIVVKKRYDGFFETSLDLVLRQVGVGTTVLAGVHTDVCVQHTAAGAFFRGYDVVVAGDCCGSPDPADHQRGLDFMGYWYRAKVSESERLVGEWQQSTNV